nr:hypothetical protein [Rhizobium ruizarguesonis]
MERSCWNRAGTRDSGTFFQSNDDGTDDDLEAADYPAGNFATGGSTTTAAISIASSVQERQLALPRHRSPSGKVVRL